MKTFKDNNGKKWDISLTFDSAKRVRDLLGINLLAPEDGDPPLLTRLGTDELLLCDVIYCLIKPQADEAGITDEMFGRALGPDAILSAVDAFYDELIDFFQLRGRTDRAGAVASQKKMIELATQKAAQTLENFDIDAEIDRIFSGLPSSLQGLSQSGQGP